MKSTRWFRTSSTWQASCRRTTCCRKKTCKPRRTCCQTATANRVIMACGSWAVAKRSRTDLHDQLHAESDDHQRATGVCPKCTRRYCRAESHTRRTSWRRHLKPCADPVRLRPPTAPRQSKAAAAPAVAMSDPAKLAQQHACLACHGVGNKIVGPAFTDVHKKYATQKAASREALDRTHQSGGAGAWGLNPNASPRPCSGCRHSGHR